MQHIVAHSPSKNGENIASVSYGGQQACGGVLHARGTRQNVFGYE
jgi:hypothetical protein